MTAITLPASADDPPAESFASSPRVILHQWGPARARPSTFAEKLTDWEAKLEGVDGLYLFLETTGFAVMSAPPLNANAVRAELKPLVGLAPKRMRYNFALVYNDRPADLFDDWSVPLANWRTFAAECRRAGLVGIAFDNEEYFGTWADYPTDCKYKQKTLAEYQEQARKRGREVMGAIVAEFPDAVVVTLHGPTLSATGGPNIVYARPDANELWGPFFAGMLEGCGKKSLLCDGGELYGLRSEDEFTTAYRWQKRGIASAEASVPFIPKELRRSWDRISVSWGIYDCPDEDSGRTMDAKTFQECVASAVSRCDHFVWVYFEKHNLLDGKSAEWHRAITRGKQEGLAKRAKARRDLLEER
jgi:hypothetical protein